MSGYTVEIRTGILNSDHNLHAWLHITKPDGTAEAWGFYPQTDSLGNILYGPGDVRSEYADSPYTATSGPLSMAESQYEALTNNIAAMDATPPNYTVLALPGGTQCSMWAVATLQDIGLLPEIISPNITPEIIPLLDALIWNPVWQTVGFSIYNSVSDFFFRAQRWVFRADPLTFDLDGDGIETVPLDPNNPILFDHDADGVKTATGWIKADDAFLVLDKNGNGTIDNGSELFGDSTPLLAGGNAADGFAALSDQDTNANGKVDSQDTNFGSLRLWQDLNQNGISEANELFTLGQKGIASITVAKTENNTLLPNGNVLADVGSYTRTDGTVGGIGEVGHLGDVDLTENTFFSQYPGIPLSPEAQALPDIHGSGRVRNLREAASLSGDLTNALTTFANTAARAEQVGQLDSLLQVWSNTSDMPDIVSRALSAGYFNNDIFHREYSSCA